MAGKCGSQSFIACYILVDEWGSMAAIVLFRIETRAVAIGRARANMLVSNLELCLLETRTEYS